MIWEENAMRFVKNVLVIFFSIVAVFLVFISEIAWSKLEVEWD